MAKRSSSISPCRLPWQSGWTRTFILPLLLKYLGYPERALDKSVWLSDCGPFPCVRLLIVEAIQGLYYNAGAAAVGSLPQKQFRLAFKYLQSLLVGQIRMFSRISDYPNISASPNN